MKSEQLNTQVYPYPQSYAVENGDMDQYRESQNLNIACKAAIEKAIGDHYADNRLNTSAAVQEVADAFGYDRMLYVLAVTIRHKARDGRISDNSKKWAASFPVMEDRSDGGSDNHVPLVAGRTNPGLLDLFVKETQKAQAREKERHKDEPAKAAPTVKPSILEKIKKPVQKNAPNNSANKLEQEL